MTARLNSDLHHLREYLEAKRRARILTLALTVFLGVSVVGLAVLGGRNGFDRTPAASRYYDQTAAASELKGILSRLADHGSTQESALKDLREVSTILDQYPLLKNRAEAGLAAALAIHDSPAYRSEVLLILAKARSIRVLGMIQADLKSKASSEGKPWVEALEKYLGSSKDGSARDLLWQIAQDDQRPQHAEAARILARHMDRRVASLVPKFFKTDTGSAEVIAGLEAVGRFGLKEHRARASAYAASPDPAVRDQAKRALDRLDSR